MRFFTATIALLLAMCLCFGACADEFRPLPIDLSGGAPLNTKNQSKVDGVEIYEDPTIRVEYHRVESREWQCTYYYALISIKDASQLRTASADNKFVSNFKTPATTMAKRTNAVIAINGDFCASFSGNKSNNYILRQGILFRETIEPGLDMLLIDEEGDFHVYLREEDLAALDKNQIDGKRIINAFQFGPAVVLNGEKVADDIITDYSRSPAYSEPDRRAQRMCIAQIDKLHYMVLCCAHYGIDLPTMRDLALSIAPCKTVYILDGGNSTQMVFMGKKKNNVTQGQQNIRPITDIIYFASAWFAD